MTNSVRGLTAMILVGVSVLTGAAAMAAGRALPADPNMSLARPMTDDKCDSACDAASDKCAIEAGKDSAKQHQCDTNYDLCLRTCQGQN
jgi:hypothetical protein